MPKPKVALEGGVYVVRGCLDEHFDYTPLETAAPPVRINLSGVENANSLGVRRFLQFIQRCHGHALEFHACSLPFMDMINTFPGCLGDPQDPGMIKSVTLLYRCNSCARDEEYGLAAPAGRELPVVPARRCARCDHPMISLADRDDLFTYLLAGD